MEKSKAIGYSSEGVATIFMRAMASFL